MIFASTQKALIIITFNLASVAHFQREDGSVTQFSRLVGLLLTSLLKLWGPNNFSRKGRSPQISQTQQLCRERLKTDAAFWHQIYFKYIQKSIKYIQKSIFFNHVVKDY